MQANTPVIPRRVHGAELKAQVLRQCGEPGASVAAVALQHGLNANLVRKWLGGRGLKRTGLAVQGAHAVKPGSVGRPVQPAHCAPASAAPSLQFVPVRLPVPSPGPDIATSAQAASGASAPTHIDVELRGAHASLLVHWPASQAPACAAWLGLLGATVLKP
jgi:transposase